MDGQPFSRAPGAPAGEAQTGIERRMVFRLLSYWRGLTSESVPPSLDHVRPEDIPDIWPDCYVLDPIGFQHDPVFRFVGAELSSHATIDLVGCQISQVPENTLIQVAVRYVPEVLRKGVPISRGGEFLRDDGSRVLYRSIVLPMSEEGASLRFLLGAANCRVVGGA